MHELPLVRPPSLFIYIVGSAPARQALFRTEENRYETL
ncbi:hypothetical protein SAMN05421878_11138 [Actinobaculum suis]|uniref:Uncharacterized protein n=1 Tax=Actinobaculum suis TaxID=1657 RepID=A0A1G7DIP2_9ACTO|nr:hypothetical protein SAMN05421878_11138 [Actinobaculum suis]VDG76991.1 Uncharacterised protein [Actinobaculum suis]